MSKAEKNGWMKTLAVVVSVLVGAAVLGVVMPWEAASKEEVDARFEKNNDEHTQIQRELGTINGKLDIIIQEVTK